MLNFLYDYNITIYAHKINIHICIAEKVTLKLARLVYYSTGIDDLSFSKFIDSFDIH